MATLKISEEDSRRMLSTQLVQGQNLLERGEALGDQSAYEEWEADVERWVKVTVEGLRHAYEDGEIGKRFERTATPGGFTVGQGWQQDMQGEYRAAKRGVNELASLIEGLRYAQEPEPPRTVAAPVPQPEAAGEPVIFLVHGHDHNTREKVRSFLDRAGDHQYKIVILDEQASKGRTLVEKLEEHASSSQHAVVLLTGDDEGGPKGKTDELKPRARQNVVFELGWFWGAIGREHVSVLRESDVEQPSDIQGLVYISLATEWERSLARELKAAGFDVSLDRV